MCARERERFEEKLGDWKGAARTARERERARARAQYLEQQSMTLPDSCSACWSIESKKQSNACRFDSEGARGDRPSSSTSVQICAKNKSMVGVETGALGMLFVLYTDTVGHLALLKEL